MASKKKITKIRLNSTGINAKGEPTGTFRTTHKSPKKSEKLKLMKYDSRAYNKETGKTGMHVLFEEGKIK